MTRTKTPDRRRRRDEIPEVEELPKKEEPKINTADLVKIDTGGFAYLDISGVRHPLGYLKQRGKFLVDGMFGRIPGLTRAEATRHNQAVDEAVLKWLASDKFSVGIGIYLQFDRHSDDRTVKTWLGRPLSVGVLTGNLIAVRLYGRILQATLPTEDTVWVYFVRIK